MKYGLKGLRPSKPIVEWGDVNLMTVIDDTIG